MLLQLVLDSALHHHSARDTGAHAARARGTSQFGERSRSVGTSFTADARRGMLLICCC